jgi:hypothetical protein
MVDIKHKVVACIPSKDSSWIHEYTLTHLSKFCDKIILSDDNAEDDGTRDICSSFEKVEYFKREPHDPRDRQGALQRQELLERAYTHDPDYFLFLDADEMPSPDIVEWFNSLDNKQDEEVNCWTFPWIHLWGDDSQYRIDSYSNSSGSINWDPFCKHNTTDYRKGFVARNIPGFELRYDLNQHRCRPSNQPANVPRPWVDVTDSPVIIHYGKISEYFTSGKNFRERCEWDHYTVGADKDQRLDHYTNSIAEDTLQLKKADKKWFWK